MTEIVDLPEVTEWDVSTEPICLQEPLEPGEAKLGLWQRLRDWEPGWKYRTIVGSVAVATTIVVVQNMEELNKWESWDDGDFYPSPPAGCAPYVDMERDLALEVPIRLPAGQRLVMSVNEALQLEAEGEEFTFAPDVSNHRSSAEELEQSRINPVKTFKWIRNFYDHRIDSFVAPESGLHINIYSSTDSPDFHVDTERFSELLHSPLTTDLEIVDPHYREMHECTVNGFGFPNSVAGKNLDVYVMPELGFCLAHLLPRDLDQYDSESCQSSGVVPPTIKVEFLAWDLVNEDIMVLTFRDGDSWEEINARINEILLHESYHYWMNMTGRNWELNPEERMAKAMTQILRAANIADVNDSSSPAVEFFASSQADNLDD